MTLFEFAVPLVGFAVAGAGIWFLRREASRIGRRPRQHPAE